LSCVTTAMWFAPIGIVSLISGHLLEAEDLKYTFKTLAIYLVTVLLGLFFHILITTPALFYLVTRKSPLPVYATMIQPFMIALGTASSGAALPTSIVCLEAHGIDPRIANFVPSFGNTLNLDSNILYEAVAAIFIAQLNNIHLSIGKTILISVIATLSSIGSVYIPVGLVSMILILNTVGLPVKDIALIITLDWLIDRIRTAISVMGDGFATCFIAHVVWQQSIDDDRDSQD
ncbi:hypothetical protein PMAYCL1PPCAC_25813, partial [Pristionchus mayeri]